MTSGFGKDGRDRVRDDAVFVGVEHLERLDGFGNIGVAAAGVAADALLSGVDG